MGLLATAVFAAWHALYRYDLFGIPATIEGAIATICSIGLILFLVSDLRVIYCPIFHHGKKFEAFHKGKIGSAQISLPPITPPAPAA